METERHEVRYLGSCNFPERAGVEYEQERASLRRVEDHGEDNALVLFCVGARDGGDYSFPQRS